MFAMAYFYGVFPDSEGFHEVFDGKSESLPPRRDEFRFVYISNFFKINPFDKILHLHIFSKDKEYGKNFEYLRLVEVVDINPQIRWIGT